jgi:hypothetical protein
LAFDAEQMPTEGIHPDVYLLDQSHEGHQELKNTFSILRDDFSACSHIVLAALTFRY